jgi:hypothetical protein
MINGKQHHIDIPFRVANRPVNEAVVEASRQIVVWMQRVEGRRLTAG